MKSIGKYKEQGSIHLTTIVIAGLVLVGTVGFLFLKNTLQRSEGGSSQSKSTELSDYKKPSDWLTYKDADLAFTFDYPNTWSVDKKKEETENPSKSVQRIYKVVTITGAKKVDESQTIKITYSIGSPWSDGVSICVASTSKRCKKIVNSVCAGYLYADENGEVSWSGDKLKDGGRISAQSFTDRATFEKIVRSISK